MDNLKLDWGNVSKDAFMHMLIKDTLASYYSKVDKKTYLDISYDLFAMAKEFYGFDAYEYVERRNQNG